MAPTVVLDVTGLSFAKGSGSRKTSFDPVEPSQPILAACGLEHAIDRKLLFVDARFRELGQRLGGPCQTFGHAVSVALRSVTSATGESFAALAAQSIGVRVRGVYGIGG